MDKFMTKKEYNNKFFKEKHKKDYGPRWIRYLSALGEIIIILLIIYLIISYMSTDMSIKDALKDALNEGMSENPFVMLFYVACVICFIYDMVMQVKRYFDLDSEYKAYIIMLQNYTDTQKTVTLKRPNFCNSCGKPIGDKSWDNGICEFCGSEMIDK